MPFLGPKWPICSEQKFLAKNHCYYFHLSIGPFHCAKFKKILTADLALWRCTNFGPKMVHLPQTKFLWKIITIIFIYLLAPFILPIFLKKILRVDSELWGCVPFLGPKWPICPEQTFFGKNHCYYFHLPIGPFHCAKFKNILTADLALWRCTNFWTQNGPFAPSKAFLENYYYHFYLPISPFHCAKFKKNSSSRSRVMRMCIFWAQNYPFPPIFSENLLMSLVSFIHAYLHVRNQSQIFIF